MLPSRSFHLPILLATCALTLTGCGEGWEAKRYEGFPYMNERTAGPGIEYVRARLLPEKGPILVPVKETVQDAAPILEKKLNTKK
ncbi:MAG: hypothetical protein J0L77_09310 [Alphaproteobacteria bacterium]|nr:hypothetical protein [Alphaproteobacteria bacterium]